MSYSDYIQPSSADMPAVDLLVSYQQIESLHLDALRIISEALGHPFKNEEGKTCIDLANLAAKHIRHSLKVIENEK